MSPFVKLLPVVPFICNISGYLWLLPLCCSLHHWYILMLLEGSSGYSHANMLTSLVIALVALLCESLASETKHVQSTHKLMPQVTTQCMIPQTTELAKLEGWSFNRNRQFPWTTLYAAWDDKLTTSRSTTESVLAINCAQIFKAQTLQSTVVVELVSALNKCH